MTTLIADVESDNIWPALTKLWCIQIGDADGEDVTVYADQEGFPPIAEAIERLKAADRYVFHHGLGFDMWAINKFYPGTIERSKLFDTLVAARLMEPEERAHSLDDWGQRLGVLKGKYQGDFQTFDDHLVEYAKQDIVVTRALYHKVREVEEWGHSLQLEHDVAFNIILQERNGWQFNVAGAQELDATLRGEMAQLEADLRKSFPPIAHVTISKATNRKLGYVKGQPRTKWEMFESGSRHHIARRLQALGWRPQSFGKDGTPTVDEKILAEMPWPEAKLLLKFLRTQKLLGQLSDGKNGWLKMVQPDGRIYGRVNPNGAVTGRMSHFKPNIAQCDKDERMRRLWTARPGWKLVGCDADALEARLLGHYLARYDGGAFVKVLLEGKKEDGSDIHSRNRDAVRSAGFAVDRDGSKTLLYALIYGAGDWKLAATVKDNLRAIGKPIPKIPHKEMGLLVRRALARSMKGIDTLIEQIKKASERGYLTGLDGRHLYVRSDHAALNTLLQSAGSCCMKRALVLFMNEAETQGAIHGVDFGLVGNIHDEIELEAPPSSAECFGKEMAYSIQLAGEYYNLRCPLSGAYAVGDNWHDCH